MVSLPLAESPTRARLARLADWLVVAVAVSLPWSTSATSILLVLWLIALIPTLDWLDVRRELMTPAGGLPVLLFLLGLVGMAWADVSWLERWRGLDGFLKLLAFPLLMAHARRSDIGLRVFLGFLAACIALLIASWVVTIWPNLPRGSSDDGVIVKSYIAQSAEFTLCAVGLIYVVFQRINSHSLHALIFIGIACAFLGDIIFIATSRTALVIIPVLLLLFAARQFGVKGFAVAIIGLIFITTSVWLTSGHMRERVDEIFTATEQHNILNVTPSEERLEFWKKSLGFVQDAPWFGHGTGSITQMFRKSAFGQKGVAGEISTNPHNQTFAVAIQLGIFGALTLWTMWACHVLLFRGGGFEAWVGLAVVVQNIIGSLFNSFLFDFTEGWLYVIGAGVAAGMVRRLRNGVTDQS